MSQIIKKDEQKGRGKNNEKVTMVFSIFATIIGICLMVACTKQLVSTRILNGYGIILIIIGLLIILLDKAKDPKK